MSLIDTGFHCKRNEPSRSLTLRNGSNASTETPMPVAIKPIPQLTEKNKIDFWKKVDRNGPTMPHMDTPCWIWTAYKNKFGYGRFAISKVIYMAHRVAFFMENKEPQAGSYTLHKCDNPSCCNPLHLHTGTALENTEDMYSKGREPSRERERNGNSILLEKQVVEIRKIYKTGNITQKILGVEYGVSRSTIGEIIRKSIWAKSA